jgi:periplasmic glucans biosynthesis protein
MIDRRSFLQLALAAQAFAALPARAGTTSALRMGDPQPFSYDWLKSRAKALADTAYVPGPRPDPNIVSSIDYDAHGQIKYKDSYAHFGEGHQSPYPLTFWHVGLYFQKTVRMYAIDAEGGQDIAREILYDPSYFDMPANSPARKLTKDTGFAGFRFQEAKEGGQYDWHKNDWVAFLGASYFRAIGELHQYGLSARGITLSPGGSAPEEFPDFTAFWFAPAPAGSKSVTVYALLESPSVTGAYRFVMERGKGVVMDIEATLFFRGSVERLGLAPLTSMYWYSETVKRAGIDWRPEVHDSDGLAMWTGAGEHIWRPLNNPAHITVSAFQDEHPRGFGLLQRDRNFDHYLDGVAYEKRPSAWVEALGDWGKGSIQLVEIPTDDEINDNVTAYWCPEKSPAAGDSVSLSYRLHWLADEPYPTPLGRCVATRLGRGGQAGRPRPNGVRKFDVEFLGGPLKDVPYGVKPELVLWASRGEFTYTYAEAVPDDVPGHWRALFDLTAGGSEPIELRLYLKNGEQVLTETWLYQYRPFATVSYPVGD